jgi:hypothetical protein
MRGFIGALGLAVVLVELHANAQTRLRQATAVRRRHGPIRSRRQIINKDGHERDTSIVSSIFFQREVGVVFIRVNAKCFGRTERTAPRFIFAAHQSCFI